MIKRVKVEGVMKGESGVGVTGVICSSGGEGGVHVVFDSLESECVLW